MLALDDVRRHDFVVGFPSPHSRSRSRSPSRSLSSSPDPTPKPTSPLTLLLTLNCFPHSPTGLEPRLGSKRPLLASRLTGLRLTRAALALDSARGGRGPRRRRARSSARTTAAPPPTACACSTASASPSSSTPSAPTARPTRSAPRPAPDAKPAPIQTPNLNPNPTSRTLSLVRPLTLSQPPPRPARLSPGTLKTSVQDGQEIVVVLSEAEWLQQLRPQLEHRWRDKHRASLQHAMQPGGGVLDLQRAHPMGRPGHAHTSAPYWRLQHVEPARGFFTTLLGGI